MSGKKKTKSFSSGIPDKIVIIFLILKKWQIGQVQATVLKVAKVS